MNVRGGAAEFYLWTIGLKLAVRVVMAALIIVVMVIATTAARLTAAAPLTLHWKCTICFVVPFRANSAKAKGPPPNAPHFKSPFFMVRAVPSSAKRRD